MVNAEPALISFSESQAQGWSCSPLFPGFSTCLRQVIKLTPLDSCQSMQWPPCWQFLLDMFTDSPIPVECRDR